MQEGQIELIAAEIARLAEVVAVGVQAERPVHCHPAILSRVERYREADTAISLHLAALLSLCPLQKPTKPEDHGPFCIDALID